MAFRRASAIDDHLSDHLPLLKERYHLRRADARLLWAGLMAQGWLKTRPAWGVYAEP